MISLLLEGATGNEASQCLVFFAFAECLPPISVFLRYDVKDVTLHKTDTKLFTRDVQIILGVVVKVSFEVDNRIGWYDTGLCFGRRSGPDGNDQKSDRTRHGTDQITNIVDGLATHFNSVHFQDFIALVQQTGTFRHTAADDPTNDNRFPVVPHRGSLIQSIQIDHIIL